eukprot:1146257-Pleurochrysis_carterae.AAC.1
MPTLRLAHASTDFPKSNRPGHTRRVISSLSARVRRLGNGHGAFASLSEEETHQFRAFLGEEAAGDIYA